MTHVALTAHATSRAVSGDGAAIARSLAEPERFAAVFDRHYARIHGYVARRLGPALAEDVTSETFLIAFDRRRRYDTAQPDAGPWLYGIASNLIARHHRAEARRYRALARSGGAEPADGGTESSDGRVDARARRPELAAALAAIPPREREVLLLVAWAGLSLEEVARALRIRPGTARSRLHRARHTLRAALHPAEDDPR
jgi:RNA polymerase sigma-70 factor (ECF subfamily)